MLAAATATSTDATATAYSLRVHASPARIKQHSSTECFVTRLVASLAWTFGLDQLERELARLLLCGRPLGAIARRLDICTTSAQRLCHALFVTTGTDGRQQLFEVALRLTAMRELSNVVSAR